MAIDAIHILLSFDDSLDINARQMDLVRRDLTDFNKFFNFGDGYLRSFGSIGIDILRGPTENKVPFTVSFPSFDKCNISANALLEEILSTIEFASLAWLEILLDMMGMGIMTVL